MKLRFSSTAFSAAFCLAYLAAFALNLPLFYYYPLARQFRRTLEGLPQDGPAMAWYGLLASAALVAAVVALLFDEAAVARRLHNRLWLFPLVAISGVVFLLRRFFL